MAQTTPPPGVPRSMRICAAMCSDWTWTNGRFLGPSLNGVSPIITVETFTPELVIMHRTDPPGHPSAGLTAVYHGKLAYDGGAMVGTVTFEWPNHSNYPNSRPFNALWEDNSPQKSNLERFQQMAEASLTHRPPRQEVVVAQEAQMRAQAASAQPVAPTVPAPPIGTEQQAPGIGTMAHPSSGSPANTVSQSGLPTGLPTTPGARFADEFSADTTLNASLWSTTTPFLKSLAQHRNSTLVEPRLSFSAAGMSMSGISGNGQFTGILANKSFGPPFKVQAIVTGVVANGNAFTLELLNQDALPLIAVNGDLNPKNVGTNPYSGINVSANVNYVLYATPAANVSYTISIYLGAGKATVDLMDARGTVLGSTPDIAVGPGPFYLVLGQLGGPAALGPNTATWRKVEVSPVCLEGFFSRSCGTVSEIPAATVGLAEPRTTCPFPSEVPKRKLLEGWDGWDRGKNLAADGKYAEAIGAYQQAFAAGNANSAYEAGLLYESGYPLPSTHDGGVIRANVVPPDKGKAFDWFCRAALNGYTEGMSKVATYYVLGGAIKGSSVVKDVAEALRWTEEAANRNDAGAKVSLVQARQRGIIPKNWEADIALSVSVVGLVTHFDQKCQGMRPRIEQQLPLGVPRESIRQIQIVRIRDEFEYICAVTLGNKDPNAPSSIQTLPTDLSSIVNPWPFTIIEVPGRLTPIVRRATAGEAFQQLADNIADIISQLKPYLKEKEK
jgi:hypothetical protein